MGKLELLWGRVEKNKKIAWKNKKNLLGGSLTVALPWEGEGVPLPVVSPDTRQKHTQSLFVYVMNVTHTNETHTSPSEAQTEAQTEAQKAISLS